MKRPSIAQFFTDLHIGPMKFEGYAPSGNYLFSTYGKLEKGRWSESKHSHTMIPEEFQRHLKAGRLKPSVAPC